MATILDTDIMMSFSLTLRHQLSSRLMKLYIGYVVDVAQGIKWLVIIIRELLLQCPNGVCLNFNEKRIKQLSAKHLILTLLD